jgi:hypothetical protein
MKAFIYVNLRQENKDILLCLQLLKPNKHEEYRHSSLSTVKWFQKNRALSETALTELHRKLSVQKLKIAT